MEHAFSCEIRETSDGIIELILQGAIDENTHFPLDLDFSNFKQVNSDFTNIEFINSAGIKKWIIFSSLFSDLKNHRVVFQGCPPQIVNQVNNVSGFLPSNGVVESVFVPISCSHCDRCFHVPLKVSLVNQLFDSVLDQLKPEDCLSYPSCKKAWEVDVIKEYYFRFTNR